MASVTVCKFRHAEEPQRRRKGRALRPPRPSIMRAEGLLTDPSLSQAADQTNAQDVLRGLSGLHEPT